MPDSYIIQSTKLSNEVMQTLLYQLRIKEKLSHKELLDLFITLDLAAEKGVLTNELIEKVRNNPEDIEKYVSSIV